MAVAPMVGELSAREQTILSMRFWDDVTQRQIGKRLGLSQIHISDS